MEIKANRKHFFERAYYYSLSRMKYGITKNHLYRDSSYFESLQLRRFRKLIRHAYRYSEFYRNLYDAAQVDIDRIVSLEDIQKLPIITKEMIKETRPESIATRSIGRLAEFKTSGSTGIPLCIYYSQKDRKGQDMLWRRAYEENGYSFRKDRLFRFVHPVDFDHKKNSNIIEVSVLDGYGKACETLAKFRPDVIEGYPSDIFALARESATAGVRVNPRMIYTHSEILDSTSREFIRETFGCPLTDIYGAMEAGCIAFQCKSGHYHVNIDGVVLEVLNDKGRTFFEGTGEAIVTNLFSYGMPIIRYNIMDIITMQEKSIGCEMRLPAISILHGKAYDFITSRTSRVFSPHLPKQILGRIKEIQTFRIIQQTIDDLNIEVVLNRGAKEFDVTRLQYQLYEAFDGEFNIKVSIVDSISRKGSNKYKSVVKLLNG